MLAAMAALSLAACDQAKPKPKDAVPLASASDATSPSSSAPAAASEPDDGYRWHTAEPGKSVQFGVPESDARALRIDCGDDGRIQIGGPAGVDGNEGDHVTATFDGRTLPAQLAEAGDGMNFYAEVGPDDPALLTLLAGKTLKVAQGDYHWEVPGQGAAQELKPFIAACQASH